MWSTKYKGELSEEYCKSILNTYGAFHPIINPAKQALTREVLYFENNAMCFFCGVKNLQCTQYVPTKRLERIFNVCQPCMQDFNMHNFNPTSKDYCRLIKKPRG